MHEVVLPVDAPHAAPDAGDVVLGQQLGAVEGRILLRVDDLVELGAGAARGEVVVALGAGEALEDEVLELGAIGRDVEAEVALRPLEADLEGVGRLDRQVGSADLEGGRGVVRPLVEELGGIGRALDVLRRSGA